MERAVPSVKWKTTASAACIPRRDWTSPYSMAATVFPTASRTVCSLCSGLGGPIILGCSPLLACWLSIRAPSASCGLPLPSDTAHLTLAWARLSHPGAVKLVTIYLWPPNLITGASPRPSRQVLRPADNDARLPTAGFAPLLLCLLDKDDLVGCGLVWVVRPAALRALAAPAGGLLKGGHAPLQGRYHRLAPFVGSTFGSFASSTSILASRSSVCLFFRSCSIAIRRLLTIWLPTAACAVG